MWQDKSPWLNKTSHDEDRFGERTHDAQGSK